MAETLRIVCGYPDGTLAGPWFRAYKQVKRAIERRGLAVRIELRPVTDLPPDIAVLVLPPDLDAPHFEVPGAPELLVTPADDLRDEVGELVDRLEARGELPLSPTPSRAFAIHRGFEPVTDRARVAERR